MKQEFRNTFSSNIKLTLGMGVNLLKDFPKSSKALFKILTHQNKAEKIRDHHLKAGIYVPPLLIISTTNQCNLECKGCYSAGCRSNQQNLKKEQIDKLFDEAVEVGCSAVLLAGGEPLLAPDFLDSLGTHPELLGLVFTNGTLYNQEWLKWFQEHRNILPLFSIEGNEESTDKRRGEGVSAQIYIAMKLMQEAQIPFGVSITTGSHNYIEVTEQTFKNSLIDLGCRMFVHVEYVPVDENDQLFILTQEQKTSLAQYCEEQTSTTKAITICFPGDEEQYGGCLATGRGFAHISASGALEPCPFASYSDRNICDISLLDALRSPLLKEIRNNSDKLHEGVGGCALRQQGEWLQSLISS
ncbi:MAG: putative Fe-S oxidoreductase [Herbinix sp.]|jgi:MoaA/NifB/PqqE/SkfB family radical SAM enzyme|nr:putative Fe-S oxidoreductase [Herbinix sp.]